MRTKTKPKTNKKQTGVTPNFAQKVHKSVTKLIKNIKSVIYMDTKKLEYIIAANVAGGHVMLADSHGVGKTSLAKALAGSIDWSNLQARKRNEVEHFNRIQCTVDLLPQDILGYTKLVGDSHNIVFQRGPIFAYFILCDEINLLTPKTQGSFFQAMEERTVTVEGKTYNLPNPFFIISTMNLKGVHLFPLPAPQLDRFMIQISLGFPCFEDETSIIKQHGRTDAWDKFGPVISAIELLSWQDLVDKVEIHPDIIKYIVTCVRNTRGYQDVLMGASPRTGVKVSRLARALALIRGHNFVTIDLIKEIFMPAVCHRIVMNDPAQSAEGVIKDILKTVPIDTR